MVRLCCFLYFFDTSLSYLHINLFVVITEAEDPEYNFMRDLECEETPERDELRMDRATEIPSKSTRLISSFIRVWMEVISEIGSIFQLDSVNVMI